MKTLLTISMDQDLIALAKEKTDNLSGTINFLLRRWVETEAEEYERNKLAKARIDMDKKIAELASIKKELADIRKEREKEKVVKVL